MSSVIMTMTWGLVGVFFNNLSPHRIFVLDAAIQINTETTITAAITDVILIKSNSFEDFIFQYSIDITLNVYPVFK